MKIEITCRCGMRGSWSGKRKHEERLLRCARFFQDEHAKCKAEANVEHSTSNVQHRTEEEANSNGEQLGDDRKKNMYNGVRDLDRRR